MRTEDKKITAQYEKWLKLEEEKKELKKKYEKLAEEIRKEG